MNAQWSHYWRNEVGVQDSWKYLPALPLCFFFDLDSFGCIWQKPNSKWLILKENYRSYRWNVPEMYKKKKSKVQTLIDLGTKIVSAMQYGGTWLKSAVAQMWYLKPLIKMRLFGWSPSTLTLRVKEKDPVKETEEWPLRWQETRQLLDHWRRNGRCIDPSSDFRVLAFHSQSPYGTGSDRNPKPSSTDLSQLITLETLTRKRMERLHCMAQHGRSSHLNLQTGPVSYTA